MLFSVNVKCQQHGLIRKPFSWGKNTIYPVRESTTERSVRCYACPTSFSRTSERPIRAAYRSSGDETRVPCRLPPVVKLNVRRVSHEQHEKHARNHQISRKLFNCIHSSRCRVTYDDARDRLSWPQRRPTGPVSMQLVEMCVK
jgi:hypothetical protein